MEMQLVWCETEPEYLFAIIIIIIVVVVVVVETSFVHQRVKIRYLRQNYTRILLSRPTNAQHIYKYIYIYINNI